MPELIKIENLRVRFDNFGFETIAIDIEAVKFNQGEWILLIGNNGSGKSTLLKVLSGQLNGKFEGDVLIEKKSILNYTPKLLAPRLYFVRQDPLSGTVSDLTVWENILISVPKYTNKSKSLAQSQLAKIGLESHLYQMTKYLSGGQRQLLTILIGILREPDILLLDEPLAALDQDNKVLALNLIQESNNSGTTTIMISHEYDWTEKYPPSRVIKLNKGSIIQDNSY